jgi:hypothetical protein
MRKLKRLTAAVVLMSLLGLSALAGEVETPPCAPPEPGQTSTPPCAAEQASDDSTAPGQLETPPAANAVDMYSVAEGAMNVLQSMLTVF